MRDVRDFALPYIRDVIFIVSNSLILYRQKIVKTPLSHSGKLNLVVIMSYSNGFGQFFFKSSVTTWHLAELCLKSELYLSNQKQIVYHILPWLCVAELCVCVTCVCAFEK